MNRRDFLKAVAMGAGAHLAGCATGPARAAVTGRRFLTFNSIVRVNQIEVTRTRNEGNDEVHRHHPDHVRALRRAVADGWPGAPMTWAFSWRALFDERENYVAIRELIREYHGKYGDDVTFIPGAYFANAYNTREQVSRDLHDGLARVSEIIGGGFRPKSVVAGFLASANQKYLAEREGIHVCQGNIWSQFSIDNQDGDGSVSYPYYPSTEHFCKPAQGPGDFIDCVNLDGWTMDFLAARRAGMDVKKKQCSRMGVGPIETIGWHGPELGLKQMLATTGVHFDAGFRLNGWAWVTNCWEVSLVKPIGHLEVLSKWLEGIRRRWPTAECVTLGDFGLAYRRQYPDNDRLDYRFAQRGTGIGGSDADLEIRWFMNRDFRLALLRDWQAGTQEKVIDFTRYDLSAGEPEGMTRQWTLFGRINQKQTRPQDKPVPLSDLPAEDRALISARYPSLQP